MLRPKSFSWFSSNESAIRQADEYREWCIFFQRLTPLNRAPKTHVPLIADLLGTALPPVALKAFLLAISQHQTRPYQNIGTKTPKGYQRADFADVFERYLAPDGQEEASKPQQRNNADEMGTSTTSATATAAPLLRFENAKKPNNDGQCCGVAVANPGEAHRAHLETRCDQCGQPADPLHAWDWPGRPDGILLHRRCEEAWIDRPPVFERKFQPHEPRGRCHGLNDCPGGFVELTR
jgi:hypothetical protein